MIYLAGVESHLKNNKTACFTLIISKNTRGDLLCDEWWINMGGWWCLIFIICWIEEKTRTLEFNNSYAFRGSWKYITVSITSQQPICMEDTVAATSHGPNHVLINIIYVIALLNLQGCKRNITLTLSFWSINSFILHTVIHATDSFSTSGKRRCSVISWLVHLSLFLNLGG